MESLGKRSKKNAREPLLPSGIKYTLMNHSASNRLELNFGMADPSVKTFLVCFGKVSGFIPPLLIMN